MDKRTAKRLDRQLRARYLHEFASKGLDDVVYGAMRTDAGAARVFDDDVDGTCDRCGVAIYWRPWVPEAVTKWCIECVVATAEDSGC